MQTEQTKRDIGGSLIAAVMILLGAVAWFDTTTMTDSDSYVFPRAVIILMVIFSLSLILFNLVRPEKVAQAGTNNGSVSRRIGLVVVMLAGAGAMPYLGFIISGLMVFAVLILIAMYDPWTRFRMIAYPVIGVAIVAGFYILFARFLLVPLPVGQLFE